MAGVDEILRIELAEHLSAAALAAALAPVTAKLAASRERKVLLVDARRMDGYDPAARTLFVEWNALHRRRFRKVAIITEKIAWKMVVSTMSLASGQRMKTFLSQAEGEAWLRVSD
jgi:hypothetical protein